MHNVLLVYKQLEMQLMDLESSLYLKIHLYMLSYDESQEYRLLQQHQMI